LIRGGAEVIAALEAQGLKEAWQHVFVISSRPYGGFKSLSISKNENADIPVYRFYPLNIYYYLNDFRYPAFIRLIWHLFDSFNIFSYFKIKKILKLEKPDAIITHNLMGIGFLIPRLLRKLKIKHIHTLHDVQLGTPSGLIVFNKENSWSHKVFKFLGYAKLMRWLWKSPDVVLSPSRFLLNYYKDLKFFSKSKKIVLPNPIKQLIKLEKKESYNLELLYLGQVHKAKGVLELIEAIKEINLPALRLNIVGVGPELEKAKKLAAKDKRIKFYGWLRHEEMMPLLAKMDILIVPSLCYENSPTVIYEMLALGMPVLAADIGGVAELITEGKNGWIYPAGDFKTLDKKIISIYKQRDKLRLLAPNCHHSVEPYLLSKYVEKVLVEINENKAK
jgi:glycosyltransferase involved in cell wall biosynthesis